MVGPSFLYRFLITATYVCIVMDSFGCNHQVYCVHLIAFTCGFPKIVSCIAFSDDEHNI